MTRVVYFISGSLFMALGVFFYFVFANPLLDGIQVLTLYRMLGAAYVGLGLIACFARPSTGLSVGLSATQLLLVATLVPAILSKYLQGPTTQVVWLISGASGLLAILNLLFIPRREF
ncbi:hypothetical protein [Deinococcus roseus]|uniref:EamA domain-containing protein n=1 Tax=Deinococcus roseus TaxID=392414 RepID=A0ABQ2CTT6_9DEIO|nr:hypothetical protein [Deinococcus roseus]GGJ19867.1 hypothetical protein GCM10008938_02540 [Deinococcus roseus]